MSIQYSSVLSSKALGMPIGCGCGGAGRMDGKAGRCWPLEVAAKYLGGADPGPLLGNGLNLA